MSALSNILEKQEDQVMREAKNMLEILKILMKRATYLSITYYTTKI